MEAACYICILKKDTPGVKSKAEGGGHSAFLKLVGLKDNSVPVSVHRGELVLPTKSGKKPAGKDGGKTMAEFSLKRNPNTVINCPWDDVAPLNSQDCQTLELVPTPQERYDQFLSLSKEGHTQKRMAGKVTEQPPSVAKTGEHTDNDDHFLTPPTSPASSLAVGSAVVVPGLGGRDGTYGTIRWIGLLPGAKDPIAGIELENEKEGCGDGTCQLDGLRYFECSPGRGMYSPLKKLMSSDRPQRSYSETVNENNVSLPSMGSSQLTVSEDTSNHSNIHHPPSEEETLSVKQPVQVQGDLQKLMTDVQVLSEEKAALEEECTKLKKDLQMKEQELAEALLQLERHEEENVPFAKELAMKKSIIDRLEKELESERSKNQNMEPNVQESIRSRQLQTAEKPVGNWRIPRKEVEMTKIIGRGAWGVVHVGKVKGQMVAIKEPHKDILCKETVERIEREIRIMAHIQHPNLVRFVAAVEAVFDEKKNKYLESPLVVIELLDMNLRKAYEQFDLGLNRLPIFRDVAYALHYLHEHDVPIIHRDVSAPNVLLETIQEGVWKAKVSDFGSANVERYASTAAEGAIVYAAPETFPPVDPDAPMPKQTTKIDTFSYGILICEVIMQELPEPEKRGQLIRALQGKWKFMYDLVRSCIKEDPDCRPTMADILEKLNEIPRPRAHFFKQKSVT